MKQTTEGEYSRQSSLNSIMGWEVYKGPEVPRNDQEKEELRNQMLDDIFKVTQFLKTFPRHQYYTFQMFENGLVAEVQQYWLPMCQQLDKIGHHWRHYYPGINIVNCGIYIEGLTLVLDKLSEPEKLHIITFPCRLDLVVSQFRHYRRHYLGFIDDEVIKEKFSRMVDVLIQVIDDYYNDYKIAKEENRTPFPQ